MTKVAINGLGRIGRAALKIVLDTSNLELAAINDLISPDNLANLLKYDTVYGKYEKCVEHTKDSLVIDGKAYRLFSEKDPANLPWKDLGVEVVLECTDFFDKKEGMEKHLKAGAHYVILSAPEKTGEVKSVVHGVNQADQDEPLISCASCTTNCISPVVEVMGRRIGVKKAIMTTILAYTASRAVVDRPKSKWRRGQAAEVNFVPTSTGAAEATTKVLPEYQGKFDGVAVRGPVPVGSLADLVFLTERSTNKHEVNDIFREEAKSARYLNILGISEDPVVSSDIIKDSRASVVDLTMTRVVDGNLVKVVSWYDNEWGYTSQMIREAVRLAGH